MCEAARMTRRAIIRFRHGYQRSVTKFSAGLKLCRVHVVHAVRPAPRSHHQLSEELTHPESDIKQ